jgi:hypothetical protein
VAGLAGVLLLGLAGTGGYLLAQRDAPDVTITDDQAAISVTVPRAWDRVRATDGWQPPNSKSDQPALSVGAHRDWADPDSPADGVFAGVLPGDELPDRLPRHPECSSSSTPVGDTGPMGPSSTVVYSDCPGGYVVERVVQVTSDQLLWVQVRSDDRGDANRVLDDVAVHGM